MALLAAAAWLATLVWIGRQIGPSGVLIGTLCAALLVLPVLGVFRWLDRWEPEPPRLLAAAFVWGAGIAAPASVVLFEPLVAVFGRAMDTLGPMVVTPLLEEGLKGLFVVGLLVVRPRTLDRLIDGVVYAGIAAAGFAFTENILYLGRTVTGFLDGPVDDPKAIALLASSLLLRVVLVPFMHPVFTAMIGIGVAVAVTRRPGPARWLAVLLGYLAAALLHSLWDSSSLVSADPWTLYRVYGFVMVPLFLLLTGLLVWARRREGRIIAEQLPQLAAAGWVPADAVPVLAHLSRRRHARSQARRRSGPDAARAVADYHAAVSKLAFLRHRGERPGTADRHRDDHDAQLRVVARSGSRVREITPF
jgi:RsiW-degrading membrane proteinase PrsW (M82 family)